MNYRLVPPDGATRSYRSLVELRASLEAHGAAGLYDIVGGHVDQRLPGYTDPRWGIATKDRYGRVELIPDFWRQIDGPS